MRTIIQVIVVILLVFPIYAQQDTTAIDLESVTVTAQIINHKIKNTGRNLTVIDKKTIESSPVKTLDGILQYALNVDVRSRGSFGVQADISIRGGHYDQTLILVDGVKVNDPQSGHHSLNIPVPFSMVDRIEILQGGASRVYGPSAFSGVINIITKKPQESELELQAGIGEFKTVNTSANGSWVNHNFSVSAAAEHSRSDGYISSTQFNKNTASVSVQKLFKYSAININYGRMGNDFGATNFYHPKYYNQYEEVSSELASISWKQQYSKNLTSTLIANFRNHKDMYDFDNYRNTQKLGYINFHKTGVAEVEWKFKWQNTWGNTAFGTDFRSENVKSNRLGEPLSEKFEVKNWSGQFYTLGKTRESNSLFLEHYTQWRKLSINAGTLAHYNSQFGFSLFPGVDLSYKFTGSSNLYYSVNRSLRFPTFTELYLNNSTVKADPYLKPEQAWTHEIGTKFFRKGYSATYSIYFVQSKNAIDKVKRPTIDVPLMENIAELKRYGFETSQTFILPKNNITLRQVILNLAIISANKEADKFQSFYTLNYLKQKASVGLFFQPLKSLSVTGWYTFKNRAGQYAWDNKSDAVPYGAFSLIDVRLGYQLQRLSFTLDATNLLNEKYFEHGFVAQPPRWLMLGLKYAWRK